MGRFTFYVFFRREGFSTRSLGPLDSISGVRTKNPCFCIMHGSIKVLVLSLCTVEEGRKEVEPLLFSKKYLILGSNSMIPMWFPILRGVIEVKKIKILTRNSRKWHISPMRGFPVYEAPWNFQFRLFLTKILIFFTSMTLHNIRKPTGIIELCQKVCTVLLNKVVSGRLFPNGHYIALLHKLWKIPAKNFK